MPRPFIVLAPPISSVLNNMPSIFEEISPFIAFKMTMLFKRLY